MTIRRRTTAVGTLLAGALTLTGCGFDVYELPLPGGTDTGDDPMTVTVEFRDVLDLVPQSTVKIDDVSVGKVTDVELADYTAEVTIELPRDTDLPANATAEIRQTSLLGEKFVSLAAPATGASTGTLGDGDTIPLSATGRNPEIEEVLGALSLVLNGGGVAQLKTIASELNLALEGREDSARSVLTQVESLMTQLDDNRGDIVDAIESLNRLAVTAKQQQGSIDAALEELPSALDSIDRQRDDLVKMLGSLNRLGDVGVRVIKASKDATVETVRQLQPVLTELANSGDNFVNAFHVFLTYPFVDEVVGRDPQVARNLHMGDYTNLSIQLDLDLTKPFLPGVPCTTLDNLPGGLSLDQLEQLIDSGQLCEGASNALTLCINNPSLANCQDLPAGVVNAVCDSSPVSLPLLCGGGGAGGGDGGGVDLPDLPGLGGLDGPLGDLGLGGVLGRPAFEAGASPTALPSTGSTSVPTADDYDPGLVSLLVTPVVAQP